MSGNRLCVKCQEIISKEPDKSGQQNDHHSDNKAFLQAVEQNCYVCSWTLRDFKSRVSGERQKPRILHSTTYKWIDVFIESRTCDILESEVWISAYDTADILTSTTSFWLLKPAIGGKCLSAFAIGR
jgi:hypothetical protein